MENESETAALLRSVFRLQKRLQKHLKVRKTERGEREISFDYRIVENEQGEEKICATYVDVHDERSRYVRVRRPTCCDRVSACRNAYRNT